MVALPSVFPDGFSSLGLAESEALALGFSDPDVLGFLESLGFAESEALASVDSEALGFSESEALGFSESEEVGAVEVDPGVEAVGAVEVFPAVLPLLSVTSVSVPDAVSPLLVLSPVVSSELFSVDSFTPVHLASVRVTVSPPTSTLSVSAPSAS